jgi:hypothetical protein
MTGGAGMVLSAELSEFLIEFAIGLQKSAIYPKGHPMLEEVSASLLRRLEALFDDRASIAIGVARQQLIVEGVATEASHPVLRELAGRLHRHALGAVKFSRGIDEEELQHMLELVATDVGRLPQALGLEGPEVLAQWAHVRLFPMTFAQLQLIGQEGDEGGLDQMRGDGTGSRAAALWIGLARAALANELAKTIDSEDAEAANPTVVAKAIDTHGRDEAYDQVVVGYMLQIADELKSRGGRQAAALRKRVGQLVQGLSEPSLKRLLEMGGDLRQRRQFVSDAASGMGVEAVIDLVKVAAETSNQGVSGAMFRMLGKLATHADPEGSPIGDRADGAFREQVQGLVKDWPTEEPMDLGYRVTLEAMAHRRSTLYRTKEERFAVEPERLIAMGLEIGVLGPPVWRGVEAMAAEDDLTPLLDLIDAAERPWMREALWRHLTTPSRLREVLEREPIPFAVVQRFVARMGLAAVSPLLDTLEDIDDGRASERLLELVESVGPGAVPSLVERMVGLRPELMRLLMTVLGRHPDWEGGPDLAPLTLHADPVVRREALRQALRTEALREVAITRAVADAEEATLRLGLGAAMSSCSRDAATILRARVDEAALPEELRGLIVRALAAHRAGDIPEWLVARAMRPGTMLKRAQLLPKTPLVVAALEGLATHWADHAAAAPALALARASTDPEIRRTLTPRRVGG